MKAPSTVKAISRATETTPLAESASERSSDALALRQDPRACADLLHNRLDVGFYQAVAISVGISTQKLLSLLGVSTTGERRWIS